MLNTAFSLAENIKYNVGLYELWLTKGRIYGKLEQLDSSIQFFERAKEIALEIDDKQRQVQSLYIIGNAFNSINKKRQAIRYLKESLELAITIENKDQNSATSSRVKASFPAPA